MTRSITSRSANGRLSLLAVIALSLAAGWLVYSRLLLPRGPFNWDEAAHALKGLLIAHDVQRGDLLGLLYDSYRQVLWPPVHSWLAGLAFLVAGPSPAAAGAVSLVAFVAAAPLLALTARRLPTPRPGLAGLIAAVLFLASPGLLAFAAQSMLEIPGLLALILALLAAFAAGREGAPPSRYALVGLAVALTFLVRIQYGALLIIVLGIARLVDLRFTPFPLWRRQTLHLAWPLLLVLAVWFAYPPKLAATWRWLVNVPDGVADPYSLEGWLFYPRALLRLAGADWLAAVILICLLAAARFWRDGNVRLLLLLVVVQFVLAEFHHNKQDRYLFPLLPPLYLLVGFVLTRWWGTAVPIRRWLVRLTAVAVVGGALLALLLNPPRPPGVAYRAEIIDYAMAQVAAERPVLLVGTMDLFNPNPPILDWHLVTGSAEFDVVHAGSALQLEEEAQIAALLRGAPLPAALADPVLAVLTRSEQAGARSLYLGLPERASYSGSQAGFETFFGDLVRRDEPRRVVVITGTYPAARFPLAFVEPGLAAAGFAPVSSRQFEDANIRVDVYERP